jgi:hypothetical protein
LTRESITLRLRPSTRSDPTSSSTEEESESNTAERVARSRVFFKTEEESSSVETPISAHDASALWRRLEYSLKAMRR